MESGHLGFKSQLGFLLGCVSTSQSLGPVGPPSTSLLERDGANYLRMCFSYLQCLTLLDQRPALLSHIFSLASPVAGRRPRPWDSQVIECPMIKCFPIGQ